jgi:hypothetical protein
MDGRQRPKRLHKPRGVPIIGQDTYDSDITYELCGFKLHPPKKADQVHLMLVLHMSHQIPSTLKTMHAFKAGFGAYLAEDSDLGKQYTLIQVQSNAEGEVEFVIAKPREDEPPPKVLM